MRPTKDSHLLALDKAIRKTYRPSSDKAPKSKDDIEKWVNRRDKFIKEENWMKQQVANEFSNELYRPTFRLIF